MLRSPFRATFLANGHFNFHLGWVTFGGGLDRAVLGGGSPGASSSKVQSLGGLVLLDPAPGAPAGNAAFFAKARSGKLSVRLLFSLCAGEAPVGRELAASSSSSKNGSSSYGLFGRLVAGGYDIDELGCTWPY